MLNVLIPSFPQLGISASGANYWTHIFIIWDKYGKCKWIWCTFFFELGKTRTDSVPVNSFPNIVMRTGQKLCAVKLMTVEQCNHWIEASDFDVNARLIDGRVCMHAEMHKLQWRKRVSNKQDSALITALQTVVKLQKVYYSKEVWHHHTVFHWHNAKSVYFQDFAMFCYGFCNSHTNVNVNIKQNWWQNWRPFLTDEWYWLNNHPELGFCSFKFCICRDGRNCRSTFHITCIFYNTET